ncbi:MAG: hypothetical protein CME06_13520, partial [Gemmatimonadetes bacterium]|nr:hypothetical protein [Gemmatimonadota bacterium]
MKTIPRPISEEEQSIRERWITRLGRCLALSASLAALPTGAVAQITSFAQPDTTGAPAMSDRTVQEVELEREMASRIEAMVGEMIGEHRVLVSVDLDVARWKVDAALEGTALDPLASLPGLPVARSRTVTSARSRSSISRIQVQVFHEPDLDPGLALQIRSMVPVWAGLDLDRGDVVDLRPLDFDTSLGSAERSRLLYLAALGVFLAALILLSLFLILRAIGRKAGPGEEEDADAGADMDLSGMGLADEAGGGGEGDIGEAKLTETEPEAMTRNAIVPIQERTFSFLKALSDEQMLGLLKDHEAHEIAVVLTALPGDRTADLLSGLTQDMQGRVMEEMGRGVRASSADLRALREILQGKLDTEILRPDEVAIGGEEVFRSVMSRVDTSTAKQLIDALKIRNPELAAIAKEEVFLFEDVLVLDEVAIKHIIGSMELSSLAPALKRSPREIREKFFRNCSERVLEMLEEELEVLPYQSDDQVAQAQLGVVHAARALIAAGRISAPGARA